MLAIFFHGFTEQLQCVCVSYATKLYQKYTGKENYG